MNTLPNVIPDDSDHNVDYLLDSTDGEHACTPDASMIANMYVSPTPLLETVRELDGRCGKCGLQTHSVHFDLLTKRRRVEPLSIPNEVHRGRCLLCHPLPVDSSQRIDRTDIKLTGPRASFNELEDSTLIEDDISELVHILHVMNSNPYTEILQEQGCDALWVHSYDDEHSIVLGRIGGINTLLDAMIHFPTNVRIQHSCTEAIQNLASNHYNRIHIVNQGGAALLVRAMMLHRHSCAIHRGACRALGNLTSSEGLIHEVLQAGAGPAIAMSIKTFDHRDSLSCNEYESLLSLTRCNITPQPIQVVKS
jgi:hypothetical protein